MSFQKGKPKTGGKKKGTPNKTTSSVRDKFSQLLDAYSIEQMKADLMEVDAVERLKIVTGLAEFIVPKLQRTDIKADLGGKVFDIGYGEKSESD